MYTAPKVNPGISAKDGLLAGLRGVERWLDDRGKKAWIFATILGFIFAWPVGLGLLAYMIWSKRMFSHSSSCGPWGRHAYSGRCGSGDDRDSARDTMRQAWRNMGAAMRPSGNAAFDAYKAETIRRLQEEQEAFEAFLQRLRDAKDKSEFDAFMADRARAAQAPVVTPDAGDVKGPGEH